MSIRRTSVVVVSNLLKKILSLLWCLVVGESGEGRIVLDSFSCDSDSSNASAKIILAIHLFKVDGYKKMFKKLSYLVVLADEVWLSSCNAELLNLAKRHLDLNWAKKVVVFNVSNKWHDWSGYLAFLRHYDGIAQMVVCNDSLVTRRIVGKKTMRRFVYGLKNNDNNFLLGELDTGRCSVDLSGWSSVSWISTYLFALRGLRVNVDDLSREVDSDVEFFMARHAHPFKAYLQHRRSELVLSDINIQAKVGAMFFERRLSRLAVESGSTIVDYCAGSWVRKLERNLERLRDT